MIRVQKKNYHLLYILLSLLLSTSIAHAVQFESDEHVHISNMHHIDGDLISFAEKITIDGEISGDFIGGSENVTINGIIKNSVNVGANKFSHSGEINGSLRLFANNAIIDGTVGRSGLFFCNDLRIGKNAEFGKDLIIRGANINIEGTIHGNVTIHSGSSFLVGTGISINKENIYISGTIDGDIIVYGKNIHVIAPALIKGDFKYISNNQADIDITSGVTILGNTTWDLPEKTDNETEPFYLTSIKMTSRFLAAFIIGIMLMVFGKNYISTMVYQLKEKIAISAAVGFISFALFIVFVIILILTLIMIVTGLALISKGEITGGSIVLALSTIIAPISTVTITTLATMIYSGKIIVALLLGHTIVSKLTSNPKYLSFSQLFLGLFITYLLFAIPYVGTLLFIIISLIGVGAIILGLKNCNQGLDKNKFTDQAGI